MMSISSNGDILQSEILRPLWVEYDSASARVRLPASAAATIYNDEHYWLLDIASAGLVAIVDPTRGIFWSLYLGEEFLDLSWCGSVDIAKVGAEAALLMQLSSHQKVAMLHHLTRKN
jgi:hypothetical protein